MATNLCEEDLRWEYSRWTRGGKSAEEIAESSFKGNLQVSHHPDAEHTQLE